MTSLRRPGERNFNAVSHKPTRAPMQSEILQQLASQSLASDSQESVFFIVLKHCIEYSPN